VAEDDEPVTFGRWQAEHQALAARVAALEGTAAHRRDRAWTITLTILSGLALPVIVLAAGIILHRILQG
jgi:hypothetical protein